MRRGVWLLVLGGCVAALGATVAHAGAAGSPPVATSTTTTTSTSTTTTTSGGTTTAPPAYAPLPGSRLPAGCLGAGAAALVVPGRRPLAFGAPASSLGPSAYPVSAPVVAFASETAGGSTCRTERVTLASLSLFGGAVTASSVQATDGTGAVTGLEIGGAPVEGQPGQTLPVAGWGRLTLGATVGRLTAPLVLRLLQAHGSLPAGTVLAVAFAAAPRPPAGHERGRAAAGRRFSRSRRKVGARGTRTRAARGGKARHGHRRRHERHRRSRPLTVTPPLGLAASQYVFPVDGGASYVDTYGAERTDVSGGWHHGDDLFAPLGTPVVAVADGTLSLVGWNRIGGWRLWLTDKAGNSFYYAHLAGYARWILHHRRVRAGQVIAFLGRTGDAFTTEPHLHFEIHPHQLLQLGYDGAVDPTTYLRAWRVVHVPASEIPRPARLEAPAGIPAQEAAVVWHELLVARHLLPDRPTPAAAIRRPFPPGSGESGTAAERRIAAARTAAQVATLRGGAAWVGAAMLVALGLLTSGGAFAVRRRRGVAGTAGATGPSAVRDRPPGDGAGPPGR